MKNEEIRGLFNKKPYEDQLAGCPGLGIDSVMFSQFMFGALSLFSLSLGLGHLEFSLSNLVWSKERKEKKEKERKERIKEEWKE